jgi:hypothetical protein
MRPHNTPIKSRVAILTALAAMAFGAASAQAAVYKDTSGLGDGGRIVLKIKNGAAKSLKGALPAFCEREQGDYNTLLRTNLAGSVPLDDQNRFQVHVDDPNTNTEVNIRGKLKNGVVKGVVRFTYLELHVESPANDTLCDSGVLRFRAG